MLEREPPAMISPSINTNTPPTITDRISSVPWATVPAETTATTPKMTSDLRYRGSLADVLPTIRQVWIILGLQSSADQLEFQAENRKRRWPEHPGRRMATAGIPIVDLESPDGSSSDDRTLPRKKRSCKIEGLYML